MTDLKRTIEEGARELWIDQSPDPAEYRAYGLACAKAALEEAQPFGGTGIAALIAWLEEKPQEADGFGGSDRGKP